jgi:hypothetical protein
MAATRPARRAALPEQPLPAAPSAAAASAPLPGSVAEVLRQRGVTTGAVLLLSDAALDHSGLEPTPRFHLVEGALAEAAVLLAGRDFDAVVLVVDDARVVPLEPSLATLGPLLAPGILLVIVSAAAWQRSGRNGLRGRNTRSPDEREAMHLLLLRRGLHEVWSHSWGALPCVSARRITAAAIPCTCSIIVPVFNEKRTFPELMRRLLAKRLDHLGLTRQIILVESNSTDGTRELVSGFAGVSGVEVIWQERALGKGNAVRAGLELARGDIVLIQDADLEYELDDYDALLAPLLDGRAAFILGSRHSGTVRMRKFTDQRLLGALLDTAHLFFTGVINTLYRQDLKDPFTMFKVLRRDCLYGLEFECDRFDFDHELLIKLLLKGYRPLEIPVNYCSRSFRQGKKIRFFRDPPTWIAADVKYRLQPLRPRFR